MKPALPLRGSGRMCMTKLNLPHPLWQLSRYLHLRRYPSRCPRHHLYRLNFRLCIHPLTKNCARPPAPAGTQGDHGHLTYDVLHGLRRPRGHVRRDSKAVLATRRARLNGNAIATRPMPRTLQKLRPRNVIAPRLVPREHRMNCLRLRGNVAAWVIFA